jgi:hypothetical protein
VHWIYTGFVGILVGAAVGLGALQLRVSPLVQSVAAVLVATFLSTGLTLFLWLRYPVLLGAAGDGFGVGVGVGVENVLYLGALLVLGTVLHVMLGTFATVLPWVAEHRPLILGSAAGLYSAVAVAAVARALTSVSALNME